MISAVQRLSSSGYFTLAAVHMSRPNATARAILIPVSWPTHLRFSPSLPPFLSPPVPACPPPRNQIGLRDSPADAPRRRNGHSGSGIVGRSGGRDADGNTVRHPRPDSVPTATPAAPDQRDLIRSKAVVLAPKPYDERKWIHSTEQSPHPCSSLSCKPLMTGWVKYGLSFPSFGSSH